MGSAKPKPRRIPKKYQPLFFFLRDAGLAVALVACVLLGMYAYAGQWPPLVVVESDSMMHSEENLSHIGAIDTGDLVLVKKVHHFSDIKTYMEGVASGHKTYGDYGDVVIYKRGGADSETPIIHRAMIYLELNPDRESFRADSLRDVPGKWTTSRATDTWENLTSVLTLLNVGYRNFSVVIDIDTILHNFALTPDGPHSGYITKGDHNTQIDQTGGRLGFEPVKLSWVVGKARGEIPWFGLLKLWTTNTLEGTAPENSVRNLWISIALIVVSPILVDIGLTYKEKRDIEKKRQKSPEKEKKAEAEDTETEGEEPPERP